MAAIDIALLPFGSEDAAITGSTIEDFEDTTLIPGLTIRFHDEFRAPSEPTFLGSVSMSGSLPRTFDPSDPIDCDTPACPFASNHWDGSRVLTNGAYEDPAVVSDGNRFAFSMASRIEFGFSPTAQRIGIGLSNFQSLADATPVTDHAVYVNGLYVTDVESLSGWQSGINVRNGYLLVTATDGDTIETVTVENLGGADGLVFDKLSVLAATPVPIPSWLPVALATTLIGAGALTFGPLRCHCQRPDRDWGEAGSESGGG